MKKFAFTLIACLAFVQSTYAATSALTESLLEYEAITNAIGAPDQDVIGPNQFIVDIKRVTKRINILGEVKYKIWTRHPHAGEVTLVEHDQLTHCSNENHDHIGRQNFEVYIATLLVSPNPGIGPNIVTVESIRKVRD